MNGSDPAPQSDSDGPRITLTVGPVAHGGHCVARIGDVADGRVVFVRHALPGERVVAEITEDTGGRFCRADAVEIVQPSPRRVAAPCPHAGAGRCGGCDWQHVEESAQRELKAEVVREQLRRLAGLEREVLVEPLPGGLLGWRTRTQYAVGSDDRLGLRRHRSHEVERLDWCPLGVAGVGDGDQFVAPWPGAAAVEVAVGIDARAVIVHSAARGRTEGGGQGRAAGDGRRGRRAPRPQPDRIERVEGPARLHHRAGGRQFRVSAGGFWQIHPDAPDTFLDAVLEALSPGPGDRVLDLYSGAGLFSAVLGDRVGPSGAVVAVEGDAQAAADAALNVRDLPWVRVVRRRVDARAIEELGAESELIVLDPPRSGAGTDVIGALGAGAARAVAYVACDPAALARDVATAREHGWELTSLRAFDAFPMTHHVECVALLTRD
ncbi:MAG: class I SAM-dependent RNA methyltransferase [Actinobacteria bacterium]|nr:class I SAM-dependent RNA methyltransferase [Actinomycetota bacterium]